MSRRQGKIMCFVLCDALINLRTSQIMWNQLTKFWHITEFIQICYNYCIVSIELVCHFLCCQFGIFFIKENLIGDWSWSSRSRITYECKIFQLKLNKQLLAREWLMTGKIFSRLILAFVYPWYTNTEHNGKKDKINSIIHIRIPNILYV